VTTRQIKAETEDITNSVSSRDVLDIWFQFWLAGHPAVFQRPIPAPNTVEKL